MEKLVLAKDYIQAAPAPMAAMRGPHRSDARGMARRGEPIVNGRPDPAARHRGLALPLMAGDEQYHPVARGRGLLQRIIDCIPRPVEIVAVKIERAIGSNAAAAQALVPFAIERRRS